jgi:hypothetical protein
LVADGSQKNERTLETAKFHMELFKHMGTLSLAGGVLTLALYSAFRTPGLIPTIAAYFGVGAFSLSLIASVIGMWLIALHWNDVDDVSVRHSRVAVRFIAFVRSQLVPSFLIGVLGFIVMGAALVSDVLE